MTLICVDHSQRSFVWRHTILPGFYPVLKDEYNRIVEKHLEIYNPGVFLNIFLCNEILCNEICEG